MTSFLVLRFISLEIPIEVDWAIVDINGLMQQRGQNLLSILHNLLTVEQRQFPCILLVPNEKVRIAQVRIPTTNLSKIHQALPFAVEELIAEELETTHLATAEIERGNNGLIDVAIVRHQLIIEWIDLCHQFEFVPQYIFPDGLCIPWEANSWSFFLDGTRVLVRDEKHHAQAVHVSLSGILLNEMIGASVNSQVITALPRINFFATERDSEGFRSWRSILSITSNHDCRDSLFREDVFEIMSTKAVQHHNELINLRQGGYKVPVNYRNNDKSTKKTLFIALAGCLLFGLICLGKGLWYKSQQDSVEQQSIALYKQIYPQALRIFNPRRQMESSVSMLNNAGNDDQFIAALTDLTRLISSSQSAEVHIQSMIFNAEKPDDVNISIIVEQADTVEDITRQLAETDLRIAINKTSPVKDGVLIDLQLLRGQ